MGCSPLRGIGDMNASAIRRIGIANGVVANIGRAKPYLDAHETAVGDKVISNRDVLAARHEYAELAAADGQVLDASHFLCLKSE